MWGTIHLEEWIFIWWTVTPSPTIFAIGNILACFLLLLHYIYDTFLCNWGHIYVPFVWCFFPQHHIIKDIFKGF